MAQFNLGRLTVSAVILSAFLAGCAACPPAYAQQSTPNDDDKDDGGGMLPSFDQLFPPVKPFLTDEDNGLLELVIERGTFVEHIRKELTELEKSKDGIPRNYEGKRDYAIALSSAGKAEQARKALAEAQALAGKPAPRAATPPAVSPAIELGVLRSLIEARASAYPAAVRALDETCAIAKEPEVQVICAHLKAQYLSLAGDRAGAGAAIRRLREFDKVITYPFKAIPAIAAWDPVRAAHYDVMRHFHDHVWDHRGSEQLAYAVSQQSLGRFLEGMKSDNPQAKDGFAAMKYLYAVDMAHNNVDRAAIWPNMYAILTEVELEKRKITEKPADSLDRLLKVRTLTLQAELRGAGDKSAEMAKETLADIDEIIEKRLEGGDVEKRFARYSLASDLDVPENPDLSAERFERIWEWAEKNSGTSELAQTMAIGAGIRLVDLQTRRGDLRKLEKYRSAARELAVKLEKGPFSKYEGTRFLAGHIDLATAKAILNYSPEPARLAVAERLLLDLLTRLKPYADLSTGAPDDGITRWEQVSKRMDKEKNTDRFQHLQDAAILQANMFPVLGRIYLKLGRYADAAAFLRRAISIDMKRRSVCADAEQARLSLDLADAEGHLTQAKAQADASGEMLGCLSAMDWKSPDMARALAAHAQRLQAKGDLYFAEYALQRSIIIRRNLKKPQDRELASYLDALSVVRIDQGDRVAALRTAKAASEIVLSLPRTEWTAAEVAAIERHIELLVDQAPKTPQETAEHFETIFNLAQHWTFSQAGSALQGFSRRTQVRDPKAAALLQQREELLRQRDLLDRQFSTVFASAGANQNTSTREKLVARLDGIDKEVKDLSDKLDQSFLDVAALANPAPVKRAELVKVLKPDEALVMFVTGTESTFVLVAGAVPGTERIHRVAMKPTEIADAIAALRCGLDRSDWYDRSSGDRRRRERCVKLGVAPPRAGDEMLDFKLDVAHKLYQALLEPVAPAIKGRRMLLVTSGTLASLPFHVLVTGAGTSLADAKWLAREFASSVVPSVASLKALRLQTRAPAWAKPYLGIGNPLLDGDTRPCPPTDTKCQEVRADSARRAREARERTACTKLAEVRGVRNIHSPVPAMRGQGFADVAHVRAQAPLPETRDELCAVGQNLAGEKLDMMLGSKATETTLKSMSAKGDLAKYRIVHFATHAAVAGQIKDSGEPGLLLTPPAAGSDLDDGYLAATEIAELRFDADWIVLSACNTAAGEQGSTEALSGMARSFFHAGARALMVSHWSVDSDATVTLVQQTFAEIKRDAALGRAEALRRSMLALMVDKSRPTDTVPASHPELWAPFIVVGN